METNEFVETKTGQKALKSIESLKKELEETYEYTVEELDHIELLVLKTIHELYAFAEEQEEEAMFQTNNAYKYRKILLQIADAINAKSLVVNSSSVMEEAMIFNLPQEIRKLKDNEFYKD